MKKLSENKKAYLLAAGIGIGAGILMTIFIYFDSFNLFSIQKPGYCDYIKFLIFSNLFPVSVLIFLFMISKKIPVVWENIETRIVCIIILSVFCVYSYNFIYLIISENALYKIFFLPVWMSLGIFWQFAVYPSKVVIFLCSNILVVIVAAYFATKKINNLPKRIILFLAIGFLISITTEISLITGSTLT